MHRHGYKGRKVGRERDQRRALWRGLMVSLIDSGRIETTLPKAKEILPMTEKIITKAKKGGLANRRLIEARLGSRQATLTLLDVIAPQLTDRDSGFLRIEKTTTRVGDGAEMAIVEFVDEIDFDYDPTEKPIAKIETKDQPKTDEKPAESKPAAKEAK